MAFDFGLTYRPSGGSAESTSVEPSGQLLSNSGNPSAPPTDPAIAASYYDEATGDQWAWSVAAQQWQPLSDTTEVLPVTADGQTVFPLQRAPAFPAKSDVDLNGVEQLYDAGGSGDYHFSGTDLIYDGPLNLVSGDHRLKIQYR